MSFAYGESVTVQSPGTVTDPYSDDTTTAWTLDEGQEWETEPSEVTVDHVLVGSGGSTEPLEVARNAVESDYDLIFQPPITVTPTAHDRIVVRGDVCNVVGKPFRWDWAASGGEAGLVVRCSIREG